MNTDLVVDISDEATDQLNLLLSTPVGRSYLIESGVPETIVEALDCFGLSRPLQRPRRDQDGETLRSGTV